MLPLKIIRSLPVWNPDLGIKSEPIPLFSRPYVTEIWGAEIEFLGTGQISVDWLRGMITTTSRENLFSPIEFEDARNVILSETKVNGSPGKLVLFPFPLISVAERAWFVLGASATEATAGVGAIGRLYIRAREWKDSEIMMYLDEALEIKRPQYVEPIGVMGD